ncbi:MAG: hypothetical protein ACRC30_15700 [Clostridium sp.]
MGFLEKRTSKLQNDKIDELKKYKDLYFKYFNEVLEEKEKFLEKDLALEYLAEVSKSFDEFKKTLSLYELEEEKKELIKLSDELKKRKIEIENEKDIVDEVYFSKVLTSLQSKQALLEIDKIRCNMDAYGEDLLTQGHWDIFGFLKSDIDKIGNVNKRDPKIDIRENAIVAIDFGSKSTVVAYENENEKIIPMRIGGGTLKYNIEEYQYENPTVVEFIDIENFMKSYEERKGRPETRWCDVTVAHTANNSFKNSNAENYYTYFRDLKKWCAIEEKNIILNDKKGKKIELKKYLELDEGDLDIVEIYAYYIGSYINNMNRGIYLDYIMSFPTTYNEELKDKIRKSFENGLKKSLPNSIVKDDKVMQNFRVSEGVSEPVAYVITALQEYGFKPNKEEKVFYGVMDLGGRTTDFNFGIWREADKKKEKRFDYVLEQYGSDGDRYLGGENLLDLIAYETFKVNSELIRKKGITFEKPIFCKNFSGDEGLVTNSQVARLNMIVLSEKLRDIIEKPEGYEKTYKKGYILVNLYNEDLEAITVQLEINLEKLNLLITERIESGVISFFEALKNTFFKGILNFNIDKINIFLGGNFSKSKDVKEVVLRYLTEEKSNVKFEYYPALRTEESFEKLREKNISIKDEIDAPSGKTGIVYGLIDSRYAGRIRIINNELTKCGKRKFGYYVGYNKKKLFIPVLSKVSEYMKWEELTDASIEEFEIYYTYASEAATNKLKIENTKRIKLCLDKAYDEGVIYIRTVDAETIEYVVANEEEIEKDSYLYGPFTVELN